MKISQYEILGLLAKIRNKPFSSSEWCLLSAIISFHNSEKGFAYPSTATLVETSTLSEKTIDRCRKSLVASGWLTIESGNGKGVSNKYFVNIQRIVDMAKSSGATISNNQIPKTPNIDTKEQHKRNISGLVQNKPKTVYKDYGSLLDDEEDCPF